MKTTNVKRTLHAHVKFTYLCECGTMLAHGNTENGKRFLFCACPSCKHSKIRFAEPEMVLTEIDD